MLRTISLMKPLLHINWAFSGPGIAWPEQYHLCYVPIYGRYVVTASHDSTDVFGYNDIAIGQFKDNIKSTAHHAGDSIKSWWRKQANEGGERFVEIISEGLIKKNEAEMWANEIWIENEDEEDWTPIELEMAQASGLPLEEIREILEEC